MTQINIGQSCILILLMLNIIPTRATTTLLEERRCSKCEERARKERIQKAQIILANIAQIADNIITLTGSSNPYDEAVLIPQGVNILQSIASIITQALRTSSTSPSFDTTETYSAEALLEYNIIYLALKSRGVSTAAAEYVAQNREILLAGITI